MKRWIQLAARMYPRAWRERYGDEFEALLEDCNPGWRELFDAMGGAIRMQITNGSLYWKTMAATAVLGAVVAAVAVFSWPKTYQATAVVRLPELTFQSTKSLVMSRGNLSAIVTNPKYSLYPDLRSRQTLEDPIETMQRNIRFTMPGPSAPRDDDYAAWTIDFVYPEKAMAQAVVAELAGQVVMAVNNPDAQRWRASKTWPATGPAARAEILTPARAGDRPLTPNVRAIFLVGIGAGMAAGGLAASIVTWRRRAPAHVA